jgi:hypothetical protein
VRGGTGAETIISGPGCNCQDGADHLTSEEGWNGDKEGCQEKFDEKISQIFIEQEISEEILIKKIIIAEVFSFSRQER